MSPSSYVLVLLLIVLNINTGYCVRCYICSSKSHEECLKPNDNKILTTHCSLYAQNQTRHYAQEIDKDFGKILESDVIKQPMEVFNCFKQVTKVDDEEYVLRGCHLAPGGNIHLCQQLKQLDRENLETTHCSFCDSDGCNSALNSSKSPSIILVVALLAFARFYRNLLQ